MCPFIMLLNKKGQLQSISLFLLGHLSNFLNGIRYFIVKSCNRENLELSVQQGVWATQRSNEAKLNEAFDSVENVILIFSVNRTRHFQVDCYYLYPSCATDVKFVYYVIAEDV